MDWLVKVTVKIRISSMTASLFWPLDAEAGASLLMTPIIIATVWFKIESYFYLASATPRIDASLVLPSLAHHIYWTETTSPCSGYKGGWENNYLYFVSIMGNGVISLQYHRWKVARHRQRTRVQEGQKKL